MPSSTRTFVAVPIPEALGPKLARLQETLAQALPTVRWATPATFHLTLAFLGDVEDGDLHRVCLAVDAASRGIPPLELGFEGLGVFPNAEKANVLWIGLAGAGLDPLHALQRQVAEAVAGAGYPAAEPPFRPHMTLGRFQRKRGANPTEVNAVLERHRRWKTAAWTARDVVTYSSSLTPEGPIYAHMARAPLGRRLSSPKS